MDVSDVSCLITLPCLNSLTSCFWLQLRPFINICSVFTPEGLPAVVQPVAQRPGDHSSNSAKQSKDSIDSVKRSLNGLNISTDSNASQAQRRRSEVALPSTTSAIGSPVFHRQHSATSNSPLPSPSYTSTPKRSWFANLLNFKPEVFTYYSQASIDDVTIKMLLLFHVSDWNLTLHDSNQFFINKAVD